MINTEAKKVRVLLYYGGRMGQIAKETLEQIHSVELVGLDDDFDILFSASYPGRISQDEIRGKIGVNIHTSLLPEGRGSHPLNWALIWGKEKTGITIHKIVDTYDAGDICIQQEVPIYDHDNILSLRKRVEEVFPGVIMEFFKDPFTLYNNAVQQNQAKASYAQIRRRQDSQINPDAPVSDRYNLYRSCHPKEYPAFVVTEDGEEILVKVSPEGLITKADSV